MAFVPGYKHDVFVSYAREDDADGWVRELVRAFRNSLASWLGKYDSFDIWWDRTNIDEAGSLQGQLGDTLQQAATMVVILSHPYRGSEWCAKEREFFLKHWPVSQRRVYLVDTGKLNVNERPTEFMEITGFEFSQPDETGYRQQFGYPTPDPKGHPDFYKAVDKLARKVSDRLKELKDSDEQTTAASGGDNRTTIFLAETTDDLDSKRNEVVRHLDQENFAVVPVERFPVDFTKCQSAIDSDLGKSTLFAQLLGPYPGKDLSGTDKPLPTSQLQLERAEASGVRILQWRDTNLRLDDVTDDGYRKLLDGPQVMTGELENFKAELVRLATPLVEESSGQPEPATNGEIPFVFVNNSVEDHELAEKLATIIQRLGCITAYQIPHRDPKAFRKQLRSNLLKCDGVIYLYGHTPQTWVQEQFQLLGKALARRTRPMRGRAVCEAPPGDQPKLTTLFPGMATIDCRDGLSEDKVNVFVKTLRPESVS